MAKKSWHDDPLFYAVVIVAASVIAGVTTAVVTKNLNLKVAALQSQLGKYE